MPRDEITLGPGFICEAPDWEILPQAFNTEPLTLASIENMLGMSSTVDIIRDIKSYIMGNLSFSDEDTERKVESKIDRIIETLRRDNYMPTRRVYRTPPTHIVYLDDESVERFINKISKCSYIKWRLASPRYWGWNNIGFVGVFKR